MNNKKKKELENIDDENVTKYGEQVCTRFAWLPLEKQKENANKFDKMTKNKK